MTTGMGIYDRDYNRDDPDHNAPGFHVGGQRTLTTNLVIFTCIVYVVQVLTQPPQIADATDGGWCTELFALHSDVWKRPWFGFELLTYGFLHDQHNLWHILGNMFVLWMFGRDIEARYGRREFLAFYLVSIVVAGLIWTIAELFTARPASVIGASGGISALLILYAFCFPSRMVLFMFFIPMRMWVLGVIIVGWDVLRAFDVDNPVAATAHLGGALFGFLYYRWGGRLENWLPSGSWRPRLKRKAKLRVHDPDMFDEANESDEQVDQILRKIQLEGQESLTWRERRILEKASREYQKKRR
jgi:membrane associated rhomboid family serine protease